MKLLECGVADEVAALWQIMMAAWMAWHFLHQMAQACFDCCHPVCMFSNGHL